MKESNLKNLKNDPLLRRELQNSRLLKGIRFESVGEFFDDGTFYELEDGEVLIRAAQSNHFLYLLLSGRLSIRLTPNLEPVAILGPGDVVGELSLIDGQLTTAYVVAEGKCRLLAFQEEVLWKLIEAEPTTARNLLFVLARRLRHLTRQQLQREYAHYTVIDPLTGLYSRRWIDSMMVREMERSKRGDQPLSLVLLGIDEFKSYRQTQGQEAANAVLQKIASTFSENLRPGEMVARYGENQFLIILPDSDADAAERIAERIRDAIASVQSDLTQSEDWSLTVSAGVVEMLTTDTPEALIAVVDTALDRAREKGGNQVYRAHRNSS